MLSFVNAKINIGLYVTNRRPDGYHDLATVFYPVGKLDGTPSNPPLGSPFCDILEIVPSEDAAGIDVFSFFGNSIDCPPEKNLVCRAARLFRKSLEEKRGVEIAPKKISLVKNLPDGAGLGGGSADASFVLGMLNELEGTPFSEAQLEAMALSLGADCPFFIRNRPSFATGVGELLSDSPLTLSGWWTLIVKPPVYVSTREAFSGITPRPASIDLRDLSLLSPYDWRDAGVFNQFEETVFAAHPDLAAVKRSLYDAGAVYASMSGSGSAFYALFPGEEAARHAFQTLPSTLGRIWLLELV